MKCDKTDCHRYNEKATDGCRGSSLYARECMNKGFSHYRAPKPGEVGGTVIIPAPSEIGPSKATERGMKHDSGKIRPGLIPAERLKAVAEVMTYGANKYAPDNWKQVSPERYIDALWRHYIAWKTGEQKDAESGLSHAAHFATNALFLLYFETMTQNEANQ